MNENYIVEDISNVANRAWFSIKDFEFDIDSNCRTALTKKFLEKKTNIPSIVELKEMFRTDFNQMHTALFIRKIFTMISKNKKNFNVKTENVFLTFDSAGNWRDVFLEELIKETFEKNSEQGEVSKEDVIYLGSIEIDAYKGGRAKTPELKKSKKEIKKAIELFYYVATTIGLNTYKKEGYEADDFYYLIKKQLIKNGAKGNLIFATNDHDMDQLANSTEIKEEEIDYLNAVKYDTITNKIIQEIGFKSLMKKIIIGDSSDNISSILPSMYLSEITGVSIEKEKNLKERVLGEKFVKGLIDDYEVIDEDNFKKVLEDLVNKITKKYYAKILKKTKEVNYEVFFTEGKLKELIIYLTNRNLMLIDMRSIPIELEEDFERQEIQKEKKENKLENKSKQLKK